MTDGIEIEAARHDRAHQTIEVRYLAVGGRTGMRPLSLRYAWPAEIDLMARLPAWIASTVGAGGAERRSTRRALVTCRSTGDFPSATEVNVVSQALQLQRRGAAPHRPRRDITLLKGLEDGEILEGVQRDPEAVVLIRRKASCGRQRREWRVDQILTGSQGSRMPARNRYPPPLTRKSAEATSGSPVTCPSPSRSTTWNEYGRTNREQSRHRIPGAEVLDQAIERRVGEGVAVVGQEDLLALEQVAHPAQAFADRGVETGVGEGDPPVGDVGVSSSMWRPPSDSTKSFDTASS